MVFSQSLWPVPISTPLFTSSPPPPLLSLFFFNDTATTEIYTLSLHDALPISTGQNFYLYLDRASNKFGFIPWDLDAADRKSTRLNSSHQIISYAVFCLKKKK